MRLSLVLLATAFALGAQQLPRLEKVYPGPKQPLPFSHRAHAARGVTCKTCHPIPDPGDFAEIIGAKLCAGCHQASGASGPAITKLSASGASVSWAPVYVVPDYVFFSHREHVDKVGASCADCHGDVASAELLGKERDISMAACMACHRAKNASNECDFCHEPRGATP